MIATAGHPATLALLHLAPRPGDLDGAWLVFPHVSDSGERERVALAAEERRVLCVADDSGLAVDALGGRPGVRSARYAGEQATYEDNCRKLLQELNGVPRAKRGARFVTVEARADGTVEVRSVTDRAVYSKVVVCAGRETAHEAIKEHALAAAKALRSGTGDADLLGRLAGDKRLGLSRKALQAILSENARFVGAAPHQVDSFLDEVKPLAKHHRGAADYQALYDELAAAGFMD